MLAAVIPLAVGLLGISLQLRTPCQHWRRALLRSVLLCGAYAVLTAELLGLFHAITGPNLAAAWTLLMAGAVLFIFRHDGLPDCRKIIADAFVSLHRWDGTLLLVVLGIVVAVGIVAFYSPPQSVDSLNYHMSRVAHWAQNQSLAHYATGIESQNSMSPGSEILFLHVYVLGGGDRLVNGVQWLSMVICILGAVEIAGQLGAGRTCRMLAAVIVASLPMGLAEASNTMSDYVAALWTLLTVGELLRLLQATDEKARQEALLFTAMAAGLAFVTKATTVPYLAIAAMFVVATLWKFCRKEHLVRVTIAGAVLIVALNVGYLWRNYETYRHPLGSGNVARQQNALVTVPGILSNLVRNAALHAGTPWKEVNEQIFRAVLAVHVKLGVELDDPRTTGFGFFTIGPPTTEEASAGNPLQAVLALICFLLVLVRWRREDRLIRGYMLSVVAGFLLFSAVFKWQIWGSRLQLPFFILLAPITACILARRFPSVVLRVVAMLLLFYAWPWVMSISSRPLIPNAQSRTDRSIFSLDRNELYALTTPWMGNTVAVVTEPINAQNCREVGLMLSGAGMEYLYWDALGAPADDLQLDWIVTGTPSARYEVDNFSPCAIICEGCPADWHMLRGIPRAITSGDTTLFLQSAP